MNAHLMAGQEPKAWLKDPPNPRVLPFPSQSWGTHILCIKSTLIHSTKHPETFGGIHQNNLQNNLHHKGGDYNCYDFLELYLHSILSYFLELFSIKHQRFFFKAFKLLFAGVAFINPNFLKLPRKFSSGSLGWQRSPRGTRRSPHPWSSGGGGGGADT